MHISLKPLRPPECFQKYFSSILRPVSDFYLFTVSLMVIFSWNTWGHFLSFLFWRTYLPTPILLKTIFLFSPRVLGHHKTRWDHFEYSPLITYSIFIFYEFSKPTWLRKASRVPSHYSPGKSWVWLLFPPFLFSFFPFSLEQFWILAPAVGQISVCLRVTLILMSTTHLFLWNAFLSHFLIFMLSSCSIDL